MLCAGCTTKLDADGSKSTPKRCDSCGQSPLLADKFRLEEVVGRGSDGTTFRAVRIDDGAVVAIKELMFHRFTYGQ